MAKKKTYYDYLRQELGELVEQLQLPDLYKQSLKRRWLDQVVWADKKAAECRRWHYRLRLTTIIGGVILPALVGINFEVGNDNPAFRKWFPYLPFALSQVIAVSAAVEEFCRFGDRWRDYRQTAENLKAEGWQYLQLSSSYGSVNSHLEGYPLFASRVESIIKNDVQNYISELVKQQAKQEEEIEKYLVTAQEVSQDKTLFAPVETARLPEGAIAEYAFNGTAEPTQNGTAGTATLLSPSALTAGASLSADSTAVPKPGVAGILRTRHNTVFKLSPQPSEALPPTAKIEIENGMVFGLQAYRDGGSNHLCITLTQGLGAESRNTWYAYAPHVEILDRNGQAIAPAAPTAIATPPTVVAQNGTVELPVPYLSQVDNVKNPFGSCNVTSLAMCLKYFGVQQNNPSQQFEDELQDWLEARGLDRHEPHALVQAVKAYGCQDRFTTTATLEQVKQWLAQGNPCVVHGYFTSYGHIIAIIGYNSKGLIVHDPYGEWTPNGYDRNDDSRPEKGKALTYSYEMIKRTCIDAEFWVHFISKPGFQPTLTQAAATPAPQEPTQPCTNFITVEQLIQIAGPDAPQQRLHELTPGVNQTLTRYEINTPLRIAHFISQVTHECDCFHAMEEYASGEDYEGWTELGNTQPGDGKRFKGRGLIQLTGRHNYELFSQTMGIDFTAKPELVAQAPYAVLAAGWYWDDRDINQLADRDDIRAVTKAINGGYNGLDDREKYLRAAKRVLGC
ncbi:DUF4231 domain-containing protein [Desertifilum sp. FACHB-1129]|uniref:Glycoside hydrolase family 19 catalytic domain-containing protein n=1 Tax=Desertifilum tharense IPPAS B-1220 TaxID=1781255 RepID=A0A1E5QL45_9CYAN|nr:MULTISPECIES: DUF4231 domain-containing protein [Desertifilum]MDA0211722.1 DUF4231 domain-containing protein [Cyanobacteria bacterium FC1]MBD2311952.1 DUF4231 domain-containing protein [Desertifilum sp. FACHB-1129]MBD2322404.1 DUF4231 domain-containing protein [Desertifilum sp. FACHB-866]MBD2332567.1 DUF4231 domain-containing protein [Desertifilum sp. FACHB-868]OEJ75348.1 hypothetical protein BH720_10150 [Desertifilum tharense IPPAS B-1220]